MASGFTVDGIDLDLVLAPWHTGWPQAAATGFEAAGVDFKNRYATLATGTAPEITGFVTDGADPTRSSPPTTPERHYRDAAGRGLGQLSGWQSQRHDHERHNDMPG